MFDRYQMEVCVDNVQSVINATEGGAIRLELCSALSEGGLTPSVGFLKIAKKLTNLPIFTMIRPRNGNDFVYSKNEVECMLSDINILKNYGVDGFVFGALTPRQQVDVKACKMILEEAAPLPVTFHRAFDLVDKPLESLEVIIELGFRRLLTSGQGATAEKGIHLIKELIEKAHDRITIMPGCGINEFNLSKILLETKAIEFHGSAKRNINVVSLTNSKTVMSSSTTIEHGQVICTCTDVELVQRLTKISQRIARGE